MILKYCPICGFPFPGPIAADELRLSFDICPCCGCEYGYDDTPAHRERWLAEGAMWFSGHPPDGWDVTNQSKQVIPDWPG